MIILRIALQLILHQVVLLPQCLNGLSYGFKIFSLSYIKAHMYGEFIKIYFLSTVESSLLQHIHTDERWIKQNGKTSYRTKRLLLHILIMNS